MTNLSKKMAKGAAWLVLFKLIERALGFVSTLFLARLLVPADFGIVAMATSVLAALELLSMFGFDLALIQNQQAERRHYDTAWTFSLMFGVFNALAMAVAAAPAAAFFGEPRLEALMYALALSPLIQGFDNVGVVAFQKDLELHKEFWFGLAKKLTGFAVTIILAFAVHNFWALVAGMIATRLTSLVLSYVLHPFRPRLSLAAASDLFHFSKWMLLNNFLIIMNNRGTDFVIGRFSGARALGLYSVSYEVANLPTTELVFPISRAVFPGYSKLAGDLDQLRRVFLQVIGLVALLTIPAGVGIGLIAEPLVTVLLGQKWIDAVPLIHVLAAFGVIRSLNGPTGSIYLAIGKPRVLAALQSVQLVVAIGLMLILVPKFGPIGATWSLLVGASAALLSNYVMVLSELHLAFARLWGVVWRPFTAAAVMAAAVFGAPHLGLSPGQDLPGTTRYLAALVFLGAASYGVTILACWSAAHKPAGAESDLLTIVLARMRQAPKT